MGSMGKNIDTGKLMRELGIANKRIETLEKLLEAEKAKGEAYTQLQDINLAMITAIVRNLGEVKVKQEDINECLEQNVQTRVDFDTESGCMVLKIAEIEEAK